MKKIMFNDKHGLTRAVLNGQKTQTRRIATYEEIANQKISYGLEGNETDKCFLLDGCMQKAKSQFAIGEFVAIAMSYENLWMRDYVKRDDKDTFRNTYSTSAAWRNKMFVKPELMPCRIRITNIRIEKLQDISHEDCLKEGVREHISHNGDRKYTVDGINAIYKTAVDAYSVLINHICGDDTWEKNPYVFVYDFKLVFKLTSEEIIQRCKDGKYDREYNAGETNFLSEGTAIHLCVGSRYQNESGLYLVNKEVIIVDDWDGKIKTLDGELFDITKYGELIVE